MDNVTLHTKESTTLLACVCKVLRENKMVLALALSPYDLEHLMQSISSVYSTYEGRLV